MLKKIFLIIPFLFITNCSSVNKPNDTHKKWYPNANELKQLDTSELESLTKNGNDEAILILAMRLMNGDRIEKNQDRAFLIFEKLANKGDHRAEYLLGASYYSGAGVNKDNKNALKWFKESALGRYDKGQYWYAFMISRGYGIETPDWKEAIKWYLKAAQQGHTNAQLNLGEAYEQCRGGLERDFDKAAKWYRISNTYQDNMLGRYNLRRLIDLGLTDWKKGDDGKPPNKIQDLSKERFIPCPQGIKDPLLSKKFLIKPIISN